MEKTHDIPFESLLQQIKPLVLQLPETGKCNNQPRNVTLPFYTPIVAPP